MLKKTILICVILFGFASLTKKLIPMSQIISIPKPCHEDWNSMSENEQGRHCNQCSKTVVDFTSYKPGEILGYLQLHSKEKTCGRFTADQLEIPVPTPEDFVKKISFFRIDHLKKIAAIFIFSFIIMGSLASCNNGAGQVQGKALIALADTPRGKPLLGDTIIDKPLMGAVLIPAADTAIASKNSNCRTKVPGRKNTPALPRDKKPVTKPDDRMLMGEPAIVAPLPDTLKPHPIIMGKIIAPKSKN